MAPAPGFDTERVRRQRVREPARPQRAAAAVATESAGYPHLLWQDLRAALEGTVWNPKLIPTVLDRPGGLLTYVVADPAASLENVTHRNSKQFTFTWKKGSGWFL